MARVLCAEEERHEQADDDGEEDGPQDAGDAQLHAQDAGRQDDRQDADGGTGVEEGYGRSQSGPPFVDAGEERQDRTGADGQYAARQGRHRVGEPPFGVGAEVADDGSLADEYGDGACDEEGGQQAQDDMFLCVPLGQVEGGVDGRPETGIGDRHEEDEGEDGDDPAQCFQFFAGIHDGGGVRVRAVFRFRPWRERIP